MWAQLSATERTSERGVIPSVDVHGNPKPLIRKLLTAIHERVFDETLNVKALKAYCSVGNNNISCQFKREMGTTIKSYIDTLRMQFALQLLDERKKSVYEVACDVGYANIQTFYRVFRRHFGCTPRSGHISAGLLATTDHVIVRGIECQD